MIKQDIAARVAASAGLTVRQSIEAVDSVLDSIADELRTDGRVELRRFGVFTTRFKEARVGRNPKTGENAVVRERIVPVFKASTVLKEAVRGGMEAV